MGNDMKNAFRLQSAMEYLMTYGWAILIIAVVLGVLFQMGVFNSSSMTVRVPPGACKVLRTSAAVNLVGQCSGILPKYVAQFNGASSYVVTPYANQLYPKQYITISLWFKTTEDVSSGWSQLINTAGLNNNCDGGVYCMRVGSSYFYVSVATTSGSNQHTQIGNLALPASQQINGGNWNNVVGVYDGSNVYLYWNGALKSSTPVTGNLLQSTNSITTGDPFSISYQGSIANVQIYNASLDASSIATLYQEGIGGAPVNPQYLVGWWPLNGDTNDYSGNNDNGAPTAITYTAQYGK
jgi:hypothetical protein